MAENKNSFVLYTEQKEIFEAVSDEQAGKLIKHIFRYVNDENPTTDDEIVRALFIGIKQTLKRDLKKWETKQQQRIEAGRKSAEKRKKAAEFAKRNQSQNKRPLTNDDERQQTSTVNVNGNGNVNGNVNVLSKDSESNARAIEILRQHKKEQLDILWMQNKNQIADKNKLVDAFNDKMDLELAQGKIEFDPHQLMPRFSSYLRQWVSNENNSNNTPEPNSWESGKIGKRV